MEASHRPSDEQITIAVMNLQAMLNIDDMDKLLQLLEQNDWDESKAANHFLAQQMQATGGLPQRNEEMLDHHDDVRAPI
jgi:hypothetical protein